MAVVVVVAIVCGSGSRCGVIMEVVVVAKEVLVIAISEVVESIAVALFFGLVAF